MPDSLDNPETHDATQTQDTDSNPSVFVPSAVAATESAVRHPALLVLHDWYGLDDATRTPASRLTDMGYVTYAPDLFARKAPEATEDAALADWTHSLSNTQIVNDIMAAIDMLAAREEVDATNIGLIGWGWGGTYALIAAAHDGRIRVVADIGGDISYPVLTPKRPGSPLNFVANLTAPFFAAYASDDPTNPPNEIERLSSRLVEHDKIGEVKVYASAPARFWRDPALPQTVALWRRLGHFLQTHLTPRTSAENELANILAHEQGFPDAGALDTGYPNEESRLHA